MTEVTPVMVVDRMLEILAKPEAWTKGYMAKNRHGGLVPFQSASASCFCVYGAHARACAYLSAPEEVANIAEDYISDQARLRGYLTEVDFNDSADTKHADVIALMLAAKAELEATCPA